MAVRLAPTMTTSLMGTPDWGPAPGPVWSRLCGDLLHCRKPIAGASGALARVQWVSAWNGAFRRYRQKKKPPFPAASFSRGATQLRPSNNSRPISMRRISLVPAPIA
ncbi:hypothetical protein GCM10027431_13390 [Lysobacter rhizosphaerae]